MGIALVAKQEVELNTLVVPGSSSSVRNTDIEGFTYWKATNREKGGPSVPPPDFLALSASRRQWCRFPLRIGDCCSSGIGTIYFSEFEVEQEKKMNGHILNIEHSEDFIDAAFTNCVNEETSTYRKSLRTT
ncbi:hypothetical protein C8R45DRAFT_941046 [Mycena sanguinolenta]|nr:hypothetical protein C8R45DRAFT_941046 [Mycena sanguinolenta]